MRSLFMCLALLLTNTITVLHAQNVPLAARSKHSPLQTGPATPLLMRGSSLSNFYARSAIDNAHYPLFPQYQFALRPTAESWPPAAPANISHYATRQSSRSYFKADSVREAWANDFRSGQAPGSDFAHAIALDDAGNVYVTGESNSSPYGADYLTVKYNASGKLQWTARYNGEGNGSDYAVAIAVDASGNVYVAGSSRGLNGLSDIVTIKYDAKGSMYWLARFHDQNHLSANALDMQLDAAGNVCVAGGLNGTTSELFALKYTANGAELWVSRYNKARHNSFRKMTVDAVGNVYVSGLSGEERGREDFLTMKYDANGIEQWAVSYNGPDDRDDYITALALDATANVYVMGECRGQNAHYAVIKYDSTGAQQWVKQMERGINLASTSSALAIDQSGNVYAAAARVNDHDYTLIKYNAAGVTQWNTHYDDAGVRMSNVVALALDSVGNILVAGTTSGLGTDRDFTTVKHDPNGAQQWAAHYSGSKGTHDFVSALVIDKTGQIFITGASDELGTGQDYTTIKYDASGQQQWVTHYNKEGNSNDTPVATTIDAAGNVYVIGNSERGVTGSDIVTIKYNSAGGREWVVRYDGPAHGYDAAVALVLDAQGNVYVSGASTADDGGRKHSDFLTLKYNSTGTQLWAARYNAPGNLNDEPFAMTLDDNGNVHVIGLSSLSAEDNALLQSTYVAVKYNAESAEQAAVQYHDLASIITTIYSAVAMDNHGNVWFTGLVDNANPPKYATVKYDAKGTRKWFTQYQIATGYPIPNGIFLDSKGNAYVVGLSYKSSYSDPTYGIIKYGATGGEEWVARSEKLQSRYGSPTAVAIDISGNIYVTGGAYYETTPQFGTVKFNAHGEEQWAAHYVSPNGYGFPTALAVDGLGQAYVTGWSSGGGTNDDFATVKYDADGQQEWVARYNSYENVNDNPAAIAVNNWGTVVVTGTVGGWSGGYINTITYAQDESQYAPRNYTLSQNFPNPFANTTNIPFRLTSTSFVSLKIYNLLGETVTSLVEGVLSRGEYRYQWTPRDLPSGVYIYRLAANGSVQTRKIVFMR